VKKTKGNQTTNGKKGISRIERDQSIRTEGACQLIDADRETGGNKSSYPFNAGEEGMVNTMRRGTLWKNTDNKSRDVERDTAGYPSNPMKSNGWRGNVKRINRRGDERR